MSAAVLQSHLGADSAAVSQMGSGGQCVTATSKRRHAGGILSSGAEFVEIQG